MQIIFHSSRLLLVELEFGKVLGNGTFGVVREVTHIRLSLSETESWSNSSDAETETNGSADGSEITGTDGRHYNIGTVRELIAQRCMRNGEAQYAVKTLKDDLDDLDAATGRVDLAFEVKFLHSHSHPNIIKMRGVFGAGDPSHPDFFFVMDRLYGTLGDRILEWKKKQETNPRRVLRNILFVKRGTRGPTKRSAIERLLVAYDIASALRYIHSHKLVYRDVKPENVGFDIRGNVKLFDFGLTRSLDPELRNARGMYHFTERTGSIPYMAPEVAMMEPYNEKCDVYSFGILLWEILSLNQAYASIVHSPTDFFQHVIEKQIRPPITRKWPLMVKHAMLSAWSESPQLRPSMIQICTMLQAPLDAMAADENAHK